MNATPLKLRPAGLSPRSTQRLPDWRVLVVDDDVEVHAVTRLILGKMRYKNRGIELLCAHSAAQARTLLENESNIAVVLLDVVMETDDAGLRLVSVIRQELGNVAMRIILRTGQPGQAPEEQVIVDYDINDYKAKSELTAQKLFTSVVAALRSYETIVALEKNHRGLEKIIDSTRALFQVHSLAQFAAEVLAQLAAFLGCPASGVLCVQDAPSETDKLSSSAPHPAHSAHSNNLRVLARTGDCSAAATGSAWSDAELLQTVSQALQLQKNQLTDKYTVIYLNTGSTQAAVALLHGGLAHADASERQLLKVFTEKISIALANALTHQKMITAEQAATTDFLTGLNNRRQLLRLGVPLLAGAVRHGTPLAVAMLDIDYFKRINDTWGHDAGDEVLARIGQLLQTGFRSSDVVARFGGEEFCVIAPGLSPDDAFALFDAFRDRLAQETFAFDGESVAITISIGISNTVVDNIDAMIAAADAELYRAKEQGRNQVLMD